MNKNDDQLDMQLDRVIDDIRDESVDPSAVDRAASRVWNRLSDELDAAGAEPDSIRSCADYRRRLVCSAHCRDPPSSCRVRPLAATPIGDTLSAHGSAGILQAHH